MNSFRDLHQSTGRHLVVNNRTYLFFGGTAYLGLLDNADYIALYKEGIDRYGLNNGTSRTNNVQLGVYDEAEQKMALRFGFEESALFSSGYLAAQATVRALVGERKVFYAPASHPALWLDGNPNISDTFTSWANNTVQEINKSTASQFVIISNCIDNLKPENYDFSVFGGLREDKDVLFILDDSHGLAIVNKNNISSDISALQGRSSIEVVVVSSLAKGLGTDAGLVLGSKDNISAIRKHPIFMGASPASPASIYALIHSDSIYEQAFERLHMNINYFAQLLSGDNSLAHIANFPVFSSLDSDLYGYLCQEKILISSFPYPLPTSPALNRIVISSLHQVSDLDTLYDVFSVKGK